MRLKKVSLLQTKILIDSVKTSLKQAQLTGKRPFSIQQASFCTLPSQPNIIPVISFIFILVILNLCCCLSIFNKIELHKFWCKFKPSLITTKFSQQLFFREDNELTRINWSSTLSYLYKFFLEGGGEGEMQFFLSFRLGGVDILSVND